MKQALLEERYPIYSLRVDKSETSCGTIDEVIAHFIRQIEAHPVARLISVFDHYSHTSQLSDSYIEESILDACDVIFCFGLAIPSAEVLAVRPRSIGIAECDSEFVISFLEAPMPMANTAMENWAHALRDR